MQKKVPSIVTINTTSLRTLSDWYHHGPHMPYHETFKQFNLLVVNSISSQNGYKNRTPPAENVTLVHDITSPLKVIKTLLSLFGNYTLSV